MYLHCPCCRSSAWLGARSEPRLRCHHCDTVLTPMPAGTARALAGAVRKRFDRDVRRDAARPRFVRD